MIGIKSIAYETNVQKLLINVNKKIQITYNESSWIISEEKFFDYVSNLFNIISNWNNEYIDIKSNDSSTWKLTIIFSNNDKKEYSGRSYYPYNFEAFKRLNQKLIEE